MQGVIMRLDNTNVFLSFCYQVTFRDNGNVALRLTGRLSEINSVTNSFNHFEQQICLHTLNVFTNIMCILDNFLMSYFYSH